MHTVKTIEGTLYMDGQAARPVGFCVTCGGELYFPGLICLRCRRRNHDPCSAEPGI